MPTSAADIRLVLRLSLCGVLVGLLGLAGLGGATAWAGLWLGVAVGISLAIAYLSPARPFAKGAAAGGLAALWAGVAGLLGGGSPVALAPTVALVAMGTGFLAFCATMVLHARRR